MNEPGKQKHPLTSVVGVLGAIAGWALSRYCGASLWVPGLASLALFLIFVKTPLKPAHFAGAIAFAGGHLAWFVVGALWGGDASAVIADIVIMTAALIWLWLRPGLASALLLGLIELGSLIYNVYLIAGAELGSPTHRALTVHVALRVLTLVTLGFGYRNLSAGVASQRTDASAAGS